MKAKLIPALILSFAMVAGAVTINDVYAQTNTERLATVDETTMDTNNMLAALNTAISDMTASIMDMLTNLMTSVNNLTATVDGVSATVGDVSTTVTSIDSKVDGIAGNLGAVSDVASDVSTLSDDVAALGGHVSTTMEHTTSISETVNDIDKDVGDIAAATSGLSDLSASIAGLQSTVDDIAGSNQDAAITLRLNALEDSLNTRLSNLESNVRQVSDALNIVQDAVQPVVAPLPEIMETEISGMIYTSDYAGTVTTKPTDNIYDYDFTLVCDSGAFVTGIEIEPTDISKAVEDQLRTIKRDTMSDDEALKEVAKEILNEYNEIHTNGDYSNPFKNNNGRSYISADNRPIIDTQYQIITDGEKLVFHRNITFDYQEISAGDALTIDTQLNATSLISVDGNMKDLFYFDQLANEDPNRVTLWRVPLFEVTIKVLAAGDPSCSLSLPEVTGDRYANRDNEIILNAPTMGPETALLKTFNVMVDCNNQPTIIQHVDDITFDFIGRVSSVYDDVNTLSLTAGGDTAKFHINHEKDLKWDDDSDSLPLEWNSGLLVVSGSIPTDGALIRIQYDTVEGNSCTPVTEETQ